MATAFLTGIVAQTNRFSNEKTTSQTMEVSSKLLAAGANQQLVATKLQPPKPATPPPAPVAAPKPAAVPAPPVASAAPASLPEPVPDQVAPDGSLQIDHGPEVDLDTYELSGEDASDVEQIHIDDQGQLKAVDATAPAPTSSQKKVLQPLSHDEPASDEAKTDEPPRLEPPTMGGTLTASGTNNETEEAVNPMAPSANDTAMPLLSHDSATPASQKQDIEPAPAESVLQATNTLADLERSVQSPHLAEQAAEEAAAASAPTVPSADLDSARDAVQAAMDVAGDQPLPPIEALGAQYVDLPSVGGTAEAQAEVPDSTPEPATSESAPAPALEPVTPEQPAVSDPSAPPPVPPPMMPPSFTPSA